jgi:serine phosphatase RsbU (regulator of sigma subunit)
MLVACSDGTVEQREPGGEMFGYEPLLRLIERGAELGAQQLADLLIESVEEYAGTAPSDDDRTVVVVRSR